MLKVLAVDDDFYMLELYQALFSESGFAVETAEDAEIALLKYKEFKPDLLVLDVDMPVCGGEDLFTRLRNSCGVCTPVIFSTGLPDRVAHLAGLNSVSVLKKPLNCETIMSEVRRLLDIQVP